MLPSRPVMSARCGEDAGLGGQQRCQAATVPESGLDRVIKEAFSLRSMFLLIYETYCNT